MASSEILISEKGGTSVKAPIYCCLLCSRDNCLKFNCDPESYHLRDSNEEITCLEEDERFSKIWREFVPPPFMSIEGYEKEEENYEELLSSREQNLVKVEQLVNNFVLTKLLDISPCKLGDDNKQVNQWLPICEDCLLTGVKKCWILDQEIKRLTEQFHQIKQEMKEVMFERMEEMDRRRKRRARRKKRKITGGCRAPIHSKILKLITSSLNCSDSNDKQSDENDKPKTTATEEVPDDALENFPEDHDDNYDDYETADNNERGDKGGGGDDIFGCGLDDLLIPPPRKRVRKNLVCRRCNSRFHTQDERAAHMSLHDLNDSEGSSALTCPICQFPCRTNLEVEIHHHTRHVIPGRHTKAYQCPIALCTYQTKQWKSLKDHCDNQHPSASSSELGGEISLKCEQCDIQHDNLLAYRYHMQITHQQIEEHQCSECGVIFTSKDKLLFHVYGTHKRDSSYQCETCGMGFGRKYHLDKHMISHDKRSRREFVCHLCGMDYAYQFTLDNHYKTHHPNEGADGGRGLTEEEEFKCKYCDLKSPYKVVIWRHLQKHKEEMGHKCEKCGKWYMNRNGLRRHLEINHPEGEDKGRDWRCRWCNKGGYLSRNAVDTHERKFCRVRVLKEGVKEEGEGK